MADRGRRAADRSRQLTVIAVALLVLGVVFGVLYRVENGREHHSYNSGAQAPNLVRITVGKQYEVSTPGGIDALQKLGVSITDFSCTYTSAGVPRELDLTALGSDTRTVHAVATFVGPITGSVHIACQGFPHGVFVDDADGVDGDPAGLFVLLATIALTIGAALALSVLYRRESSSGRRARRPRPQPEYGQLLGSGDGPSESWRDEAPPG